MLERSRGNSPAPAEMVHSSVCMNRPFMSIPLPISDNDEVGLRPMPYAK